MRIIWNFYTKIFKTYQRALKPCLKEILMKTLYSRTCLCEWFEICKQKSPKNKYIHISGHWNLVYRKTLWKHGIIKHVPVSPFEIFTQKSSKTYQRALKACLKEILMKICIKEHVRVNNLKPLHKNLQKRINSHRRALKPRLYEF